ncbi:site-specific DNA-methyltransferase [Chitinophaga sp. S165]|uniref:DNA-methyltransferase n=1 Tax=Chitinophaga sp. S165 TaxID=2135462 RepID=UPI000D70ECDF|nr:site-specific DNA-methyltransferase [Chitinophaga sp. S165]PWV55552.1 site-specific DNA-methyltransferase (adenine-specific) [Chitinophaga sp. S165]
MGHTNDDKPYYECAQQGISLFKNDAISFPKKLPNQSVDLIVTDPAYSGMNQRLKIGSGKILGRYTDAGKDKGKWFAEFRDTEDNYRIFLQECFRVLKNDRHIYIMFDSYSLVTLAPVVRGIFEVKNILCWDKVNIGLGHYFRIRHEFILFSSKGKRALNSKAIPDIWKIKRVVKPLYPTQKPTEVFEMMLIASAKKDFVVCDPFLDSGSSAIAALKFHCLFMGCDISEKSMSYSKERIVYFLESGINKFQPLSLVGDDEALLKLFITANSR